jgi:hypothetical protein
MSRYYGIPPPTMYYPSEDVNAFVSHAASPLSPSMLPSGPAYDQLRQLRQQYRLSMGIPGLATDPNYVGFINQLQQQIANLEAQVRQEMTSRGFHY